MVTRLTCSTPLNRYFKKTFEGPALWAKLCVFKTWTTKLYGKVCHKHSDTSYTNVQFSVCSLSFLLWNSFLTPVLNVFLSCDCLQTSMPLKWSCGSTVFALDLHPSRVPIVTKPTPVVYEDFQLWLDFLPQHFNHSHLVIYKTKNEIWLNTLWVGYELWRFHVHAFQFTTELQQSRMPWLKGFKVLVCFSQPMCLVKSKHYIIN